MNKIKTAMKQGLEEFRGMRPTICSVSAKADHAADWLKSHQKDLLDAVVAEVKGKRQDNLPSSLQDPSGFCSGMGHNLALTDIETLINNSTGV